MIAGAVKPIEVRKPWRRRHPLPLTEFPTYTARLHALAGRHGVPPASLKALVEDAFGRCDSAPTELESKQALMKLAKLKVGPSEINWLFQYHVLPEPILETVQQ
jgi:hypothetical protein